MKRIVCVLVLACLVMGAAFAQAKANAAALDVFTLLRGIVTSEEDDHSDFNIALSYERLIAPHFSIGGNIDIWIITFDKDAHKNSNGDGVDPGTYFNISAEGRYYPQADFEKFFLGTTVGYNCFSYDGSSKAKDGGMESLVISLKTGYKVVTKSIYLEPSLSYVLSKQARTYSVTPLGWNGGLRIGMMF